MEKFRYVYEGPVMEFDQCIRYKWKASTLALTDKKALSNLAFQFKKENGMRVDSKIFLPGKLRKGGSYGYSKTGY